MAITESLASTPHKESLFCPIRKKWVVASPEERVRQEILVQLITRLGFPASHIVVERGLVFFGQHASHRRVDLLCYGLSPSGILVPLLVVECKAAALNEKMLLQLLGYNAYINARCCALVNGKQVFAMQGGRRTAALPSYSSLGSVQE